MKGLRIPVGVGHNGGAAIVDGDTNDVKIIMASLGSGDNENAFQQEISLDQSMVFDTNDPILRAKIINKVKKIFAIFRNQNRFLLKEDTITWENTGDGELTLTFKYVNIESDEERPFLKTFTAAD
jgi:hypothetical protein